MVVTVVNYEAYQTPYSAFTFSKQKIYGETKETNVILTEVYRPNIS